MCIRKTKFKTLLGLFTCVIAVLLLASCGGTDAKGPMEEFTVGEDVYKVRRVVEMPGESTTDQKVYGVEVFTQNETAPVSFSGLPGGTMSTPKSMVDMKLFDGDAIYSTSNIEFRLSGDDYFKGIAKFVFKIPSDAEFPKSGEFLYTGDPEETVPLDFTDVKIEAEEPAETAPATGAATEGATN